MLKHWLSLLPLLTLANTPVLADESPALEEIQAYLDFASYSDGIIGVEQLDDSGQDVLFVDSRNAEQYAAGHIPNAINIEWRETLNRTDEIPRDRTVVFYCNTGTLSAKAQFMMRLSGYENVKVLHGGFDLWQATEK